MKLLNEEEMSEWAYTQCSMKNDSKEIRSLITSSYWAFWYCLMIKDRPEVRKYITDKSDLELLGTSKRKKRNKR